MYLTKKIYVGANYEHRKITGKISIKQNGKLLPVKFDKVKYIEEEAGYWRKANHIHKWFVENVQNGKDDCGEYYVSTEKIQELLSLCKRVKDAAILQDGQLHSGTTYSSGTTTEHYVDGKVIVNKEQIAEMLPTASGFFFGGTDYNEWYLDDVQNTIEFLESALADPSADYYYSSSW